MTLHHAVRLSNGHVETRSSKTRRYGFAVVVTLTDAHLARQVVLAKENLATARS